MITPTVGRIVHYYSNGHGPFAAIVTGVDEDAQRIHVTMFQPGHAPAALKNVILVQPERCDDPAKAKLPEYCEWMPYQVATAPAAPTEATATELSDEEKAAAAAAKGNPDEKVEGSDQQ